MNDVTTEARTMRQMTIEDAIRWAYREELPKSPRPMAGYALPAMPSSPGAVVDMVAETWALPDNAFGVVADPGATCEPHADAVAIHEAVTALDEVRAVMPPEWSAAGDVDLHGLDSVVQSRVIESLTVLEADGGRTLRMQPSMIVRTVAILGLPDMIVDAPELKVERGANGKPKWFRRVSAIDALGFPYEVEVDGFDQKARRPFPDAYQRRFLDPDPVPSLVNRARGELWRAAMDLLFEDLSGTLSSIVLLPCAWPERPWEGSGPRILPDLHARRWQFDRPSPNRRVVARPRQKPSSPARSVAVS
jgi:hypothetical protein